jgi:hypothetical protein
VALAEDPTGEVYNPGFGTILALRSSIEGESNVTSLGAPIIEDGPPTCGPAFDREACLPVSSRSAGSPFHRLPAEGIAAGSGSV